MITSPRLTAYNFKFFERLRRLRQQSFDYDLTLERTPYITSMAEKNTQEMRLVKNEMSLIIELDQSGLNYLEYRKNKTLLKVG